MEELFDAIIKRLKKKVTSHTLIDIVLEAKKYEPVLRNFVDHARTNQAASVSPEEVKRAVGKWFEMEKGFWCNDCRHFVEYHKTKDKIECLCGKNRLTK